jgi:hypothetical protein
MCSRPFETRSLFSSLATTHRGFAFYVAFPKSSIRPAGLPMITRTAPCLRQLPSCVAVYPREFPIAHATSGTNALENIVITCGPCNFGRIHYSLEESDSSILEHANRYDQVGMA